MASVQSSSVDWSTMLKSRFALRRHACGIAMGNLLPCNSMTRSLQRLETMQESVRGEEETLQKALQVHFGAHLSVSSCPLLDYKILLSLALWREPSPVIPVS